MILRRVTEHVKAQNWVAVGIDLVIVVLGVFIGLEVQQWAEGQRQARLERAYTERLQAEVVSLMATRAFLVERRTAFNDALTTATKVLTGAEDRELTDLECTGIAYSYAISNPTDDLASLIELQSTGQISVLGNPRVSAAVGSFLLIRARSRDSQTGISRSTQVLHVRHPDLFQVIAPAEITSRAVNYGSFACDLAGMRASRQFLNDFELNQTNYGAHVRDNAIVDASLLELNRVLVDVLGLPRETPTP